MPRTTPPAELPAEIARPRIVERIDRRWSHRVTVLRAGAGSGKTTALAQAVRNNQADPRGIDLWLGCTPADVDQTRLAYGLADALGVAAELPDPFDSDAAALLIADAVARRSPTMVSLILDDAHNLLRSSGGADLLRRTFEEAPPNLTFVFSTRDEVPIPLARAKAAGQVAEIGESAELYFDRAEMARLAARIGTESGLERYEGWPALTVLAAKFGVDAAKEFVFEEVLSGLDSEELVALESLAAVGEIDLADLRSLGIDDLSIIDRLAGLPLVQNDGNSIAVHDLLGVAVREMLGLAGSDRSSERVVDTLIARGDADAALAEALSSGLIHMLPSVLASAVGASVPRFAPDTAERWETMLADAADFPERRLLRVAAGLFEGDALIELDRLLGHFDSKGDTEAVFTTLAVMGYQAYNNGDFVRLLAVQQRLEALGDELGGFLGVVRSAVRAVLADLGGDPSQAVAHLERISLAGLPDELRIQLSRLHVVALIALGRADEAIEIADAELAHANDPQVARTPATVRWFAGDPSWVAAWSDDDIVDDEDTMASREGIDAIISASFRSHLMAGFGIESQVPLDEPSSDQPARFQVMLAVSRSVLTLLREGEDAAAGELRQALSAVDLGDSSVQYELRRFMGVPLVLAPGAIDEGLAFGPAHERVRSVAEALLSLRDGAVGAAEVEHSAEHLVTALPLRWVAELLSLAHGAGARWAPATATNVVDIVGKAFLQELRRAVHEELAWAKAAASLLAGLAAPPGDELRVEVLGPVRLIRGGEVCEDPLLRRRRVRELLTALASEAALTRGQLAEMMWPESGERSAMQSLRTNLSHLRRLLEPDLTGGQKSFYLRSVGASLTLRGSGLTTDLWDFERLIETGRDADDRGRVDEALASLAAAVDLWRGEPLVDHPAGDPAAIEALRRQAVGAAVRASELALARRQLDRARDFADRALGIDPYEPAAHAARLACGVTAGRVDEVARLVASIDEAAAEGVLALDGEAAMVMRRARDLLRNRSSLTGVDR